MAKWLYPSSFKDRISLPRAFDLNDLTPYVTDVVEGWLTDLLGEARILNLSAWLDTKPFETEPTEETPAYPANLYALVEPFLVYACFADYVLFGSANPSATGMVVKDGDHSAQLSDSHRAELHRAYRGKAEGRAAKIRAYINQLNTDCVTSGETVGLRISSSRGRTRSLFGG